MSYLHGRRAAVLAVALLTLLPALAQPLTARADNSFSVHAVYQGQTTLTHGHYKYDLTAGASANDAIVVQNTGTSTLTVDVYGADMLQAAGGGLAPAGENDVMHGVGTWIKVAQKQLTIPGGQSATDAFVTTIPAGTEPGDHLGAVVAQAGGGVQGQVNVVTRAALLVEADIPGSAQPSATHTDLVAHPDGDGKDSFSITLTNTGNLLLTVNGSVVITDDSGKTVGTLPLNPVGAYAIPGGTLQMQSPDWTFAKGTFHVQAVLDVNADDKPFTTFTSNSLSFTFVDWVRVGIEIGVGVVILIILILVLVRVRRAMKRRSVERDERRREAELQAQVKGRLREL